MFFFWNVCFPEENQQTFLERRPFSEKKVTVSIGRETKHTYYLRNQFFLLRSVPLTITIMLEILTIQQQTQPQPQQQPTATNTNNNPATTDPLDVAVGRLSSQSAPDLLGGRGW